jgi:small subunit ribosomal protein S17
MTETPEQKPSRKKQRAQTGVVVSTGGDKTIHVAVNYLTKHPVHGKYIRRRTKLGAHDPRNEARPGDIVEIVPCRRVSKSKAWRMLRVVTRTEVGDAPSPETD